MVGTSAHIKKTPSSLTAVASFSRLNVYIDLSLGLSVRRRSVRLSIWQSAQFSNMEYIKNKLSLLKDKIGSIYLDE